MKSYTDIKQSKKLAELLSPESADMGWVSCDDGRQQYYQAENRKIILDYEKNHWLPCWSLAALLNALPHYIPKYIESEKCQKTFHLNLFRSLYYCCSYSFSPSISDEDDSNTLYCVGRDNWVDACVDMIIKLKELKML